MNGSRTRAAQHPYLRLATKICRVSTMPNLCRPSLDPLLETTGRYVIALSFSVEFPMPRLASRVPLSRAQYAWRVSSYVHGVRVGPLSVALVWPPAVGIAEVPSASICRISTGCWWEARLRHCTSSKVQTVGSSHIVQMVRIFDVGNFVLVVHAHGSHPTLEALPDAGLSSLFP
jgi:hypothetical protein